MFSIFLFLVVFSFFSWLQHDPQHNSCQHQSGESVVVAVPKINTVVEPIPHILEAHTKVGTGAFAKSNVPSIAAADLPISESVSEVPEPPSSVLLSQVKTSLEPELQELLIGMDIDNLQLRPAQKIAKALNIAQKVNGRDQKLGFLRSQIEVKLQQFQELPLETAEIVRELLVS